ncbi:unnamed protein product [Closterium sp. NIES-54]
MLNFVPAESVCHVTLQGLPSGITAELSPSAVNLIGQINLRDSSATRVMTWQAATAGSRPDEITAVLSAAMGVPIATIKISQPVVEISGGQFQPSPDGTFTLTPNQVVLRASALTGSFLGSNLDQANVTITAPQDSVPAVSGRLTSRLSQYRLPSKPPHQPTSLTSPFTHTPGVLPLPPPSLHPPSSPPPPPPPPPPLLFSWHISSVLANSGASDSAISAAADARVLVEIKALAVGASA